MQDRPNVLLLVMDSVRAANMSCYGYDRPTTPNLNELAAHGTLFEQAISVGCWTLPVHASLFTGLYPSSHGLTVSKKALPDGSPTLARRLGKLGYQTACFSNNPYISGATGLTQGFETVDDLWQLVYPYRERSKNAMRLRRLERRGTSAKGLVAVTRALLRPRSMVRTWKRLRTTEDSGAKLTNERLRDWLASRDPASPFFVFVNYMENHEPAGAAVVRGPYPGNQRFLPGRVSPSTVLHLSQSKTDILAAPRKRRARDLEVIRALYDGALSYLDERIGDLLRAVESLGVMDDTVVIVTSDHGDSLGEHGHLGHRMHLYEELIHVPLIVRYPRHFQSEMKVSHQVQLGDLFPTILELAGEDSPVVNGFRSLLSPPNAFAVAENTAPKSLDNLLMRMIRTERYKYISKSSQQDELYDLAEDPGELVNLVRSRSDLARTMSDQLEEWERGLGDSRIEADEVEYDEETMQRLRGLGYVG
jgi:arylsulfatase A-like enzyme